MPPKQKITKDDLLEYAARIAEKDGIASVTSRSVAKEAGCSIQPVFSQFPTMENLRQETFDYVCKKSVQEVLSLSKYPDYFARTSKWVIDLARNKPNIFRLIYLSGGFRGNKLLDVMADYENNRDMLSKMTEVYQLDYEVCRDILMRSLLLLIGIGTMICDGRMDFSDEQVTTMMKQTVSDMVLGAKTANDATGAKAKNTTTSTKGEKA